MDGEWSTDDPPKDGTPFYMQTISVLRFKPYKPNSQQAKQGIKGRWQEMNEYGGWENCPHPLGRKWSLDLPATLTKETTNE